MRSLSSNLSAGLLVLSISGGAAAQQYAGPVGGAPVDRNVGDTGPNSASQRLVQPGLGQFGVGSLLLDRYDKAPHRFDRYNPIVADSRTSHRFLMQAPGVTALLSQPNYIGPSPQGGFVFNRQTFDAAEILTYGADTVFVLSPELLTPPKRNDDQDADWLNHPNRVKPKIAGDPYAIMRDTIITGQPTQPIIDNPRALQHDPNYVHPDIIKRRQKLKAQRQAEAEAKVEQAEREKDDASNPSKTESEELENESR